MKEIMKRRKLIETEIGFNLTWQLSNKRAQYVRFDYNGDLTDNKIFSEKEWPRPLKSWNNSHSPTTLVPVHVHFSNY